jgi:hypothetical protein
VIKKGDKVRVTRKPTKEELDGWYNTWIEEMDAAVGKVWEVISTDGDQIELAFGWRTEDRSYDFPLCVLEKVEE